MDYLRIRNGNCQALIRGILIPLKLIIKLNHTSFNTRSEFYRYLGVPYNKGVTPAHAIDRESLRNEGVNCQSFLHLFYRDMFGLYLPRGMWSKEVYEDEGLVFTTINPETDGVKLGDVILSGKRGTSPYGLHVGIATGEIDEVGDIQIIHATRNGKHSGVCLTTVRDMARQPRYGNIHAVKRTKPEIFKHFVLPVMYPSTP